MTTRGKFHGTGHGYGYGWPNHDLWQTHTRAWGWREVEHWSINVNVQPPSSLFATAMVQVPSGPPKTSGSRFQLQDVGIEVRLTIINFNSIYWLPDRTNMTERRSLRRVAFVSDGHGCPAGSFGLARTHTRKIPVPWPRVQDSRQIPRVLSIILNIYIYNY